MWLVIWPWLSLCISGLLFVDLASRLILYPAHDYNLHEILPQERDMFTVAVTRQSNLLNMKLLTSLPTLKVSFKLLKNQTTLFKFILTFINYSFLLSLPNYTPKRQDSVSQTGKFSVFLCLS